MKHFNLLTAKLSFSFALLFLFASTSWAQTETEPNDDFSTANGIAINTQVTGSVCPAGDVDYFKTVLPGDGVYRIYIEATNTGNGNGSLNIDGYDQRKANGVLFSQTAANYISPGTTVSDSSIILYCRSAGDTIYFRLRQDYNCMSYKIAYKLVSSPTQNDVEPNNSFDQAITFNIGDTVQGHIGYVAGGGVTDQYDFYKTVIPSDGVVRVYMQGTNTGNSNGSLTIDAYDQRQAAGTLFNKTVANYIASGTSAADSVDLYCRSAGDTFYFRIRQDYQCFGYKLTYKMINIPVQNDVEPNNTFSQATSFNIGDTMQGHIGYVAGGGVTDQYDFYKTVIPSDGIVRVYMQGTNTGNSNGSLNVDAYDQHQGAGTLFNKTAANYIASGTSAADSVDLYCRSAGDTFYFRIRQDYQCFSYKLTYKMINIPVQNDTEPNNTFSQATSFNIGDTMQGHIGYVAGGGVTDQYDFYKTVIPKNGVVRVYMEGTNTGNGNGSLTIDAYDQRQASGTLFNKTAANYIPAGSKASDSVDVYSRSAGDTFYFRVRQDYNCFSYKLTYKIINTPDIDLEPNNTFGQAISFNEKDSVKGNVGYQSGGIIDTYDFYKTVLPKGGTLRIYVKGTNTGNGNASLNIDGYDSRQGAGTVFNHTVANYVPPGTVTYDTFNVYCRAVDTFYFRIRQDYNSYTYTLGYEMINEGTNPLGADQEPNDNFSQAITFKQGDTIKANIGYAAAGTTDDFDYYKTKLPFAGTMRIYVEAKNTSGNGSFYVAGYNANKVNVFEKQNVNYSPPNTYYDTVNIYCRSADTFYFRVRRDYTCFSYKLRYEVTLGGDTTVFACSGCTTNISKLYNTAPFSTVKYADMSSPGATVDPASVKGGTYMLSVFNGTDECSRDTAIITVSTGQIVTFDSIPDKAYGAAPFVVKAQSSAGLPVTYKILSGPATINKDTVTVTGVGSVTIRAEQAGNSSYNYALADRTFNVNKAAASITLTDLNKVYNGNAATPGAVTDPPSLPVSFTFDGNSASPTNAGSYQVIATINSANYQGTATGTFIIQKANQTISLIPVPDKEYSNQPFNVTATSASGLPVSLSVTSDPAGIASVNDKTISLTGIGKVFLAANQAGNENYLAAQQVLDTFVVTKGNQTISFDAIPDKEFDAAPFNINASASSGLPITYSISTTPSGVASISGNTVTLSGMAGTVSITALQAGNEFYNQAQEQRSFKVLPGTPDLAVQNVTSPATTLVSGDSITVSWNVANVGKAASPINWTERIYIQSADGQNRTLVNPIIYSNNDSLKPGKTLQRTETITVPANLNIGDQGVFVVELVPGSTVNEAPGTQANNIAVQQAPLTVKKSLAIKLSATQVTEGSPDGISAQVSRTGSLSDPLTVNLAAGNPARLSLPSTVTIPAGQSAQTFSVTAINNNAIEGTITDSISASATNFTSAKALISILDDDKPSLTITQLPVDAMEGQSVTFKVNTDLTLTQPLTVFLTSNNQARFPVPASVTIPAGSKSADITVKLEQNQVPEIDVTVNIIAGASNHNAANATILVKDDDIPGLQLIVETNMISEAAGYYATKATLRRTGTSNPIAFTANLSANITNTLILPATVSLAKGENEKTFNIGVIDNTIVDGNRSVSITASIFVNSCGCSAPSTSSGSVTTAITVTDNDGPSLQITANPLTLAEGLANAGSLRVARNTATTSSLTIALTSSDVTEATVPSKVTIPAGESFVDVPVTTINDSVTDGNQQVYFQATSTGYSAGSVWVIVSDQNKPDLQIPIVKLPNNSVQAMSVFNYQLGVKNTGFATAPAGVIVRGYLSLDNLVDNSDTLISADTISGPVAAGETKQILNAVKIPNLPGQYKLLYLVNPDLKLTELLTTNNTSAPTDLYIKPDYTATAVVDKNYYLKGTAIPVTGTATRSDGSAAANEKIEVYVITNGLRRTLSATTDATGHYTAQFVPLANEAGHYSVGASYPGIGATIEQDNFDILGVRINGGEVPQFKVILKDTVKGTLPIVNMSKTGLSNFSLVPVNLPNGATIRFDTISSFAGNAAINLGYTVIGSELSPGNNFEIAGFKASAQEGIIQASNVYYYCQAPNAYIEADISTINVTASQSAGERTVEFKLVNKGVGSTGDVTINLPQINWLSSVTPKTLPSMAAGDTAVVVLKFLALPEIPFDYPVNGNIAVTAQNGNSFSIPFTFKKVSESVGSVKVIATDQFTYYSAAAPKVPNAHVVIKNFYTGQVYADGYTDSSGVLTATGIPEGTHRVTVEKDRHEPYTGNININAGNTVEVSAFLDYKAITFSWNVVPTAIQDQYDITLETKFETNVPKPVVTIDMPKTMPQLSGNETYAFNVTLTNHGLITANEVQLGLPNGDAEYEFVTNYVPANLAAQQSIQVPVIMRRRTQAGVGGKASYGAISRFLGIDGAQLRSAASQSGSCEDFTSVHYWYFCNLTTGLWEKGGALFSYSGRSCTPTPAGPYNGLPIDVGYGGGGPGYNDVPCATCLPGGLTGQPLTTTPTPPAKEEKKSCKKCIEAVADILGCAGPSEAKDVAECVGKNVLTGAEWSDYLDCVPLPPPLNCLKSLNGAADECAGTGFGGGGSGSGGRMGSMANMAKSARTEASPLGAVFDRIAGNLKLVEQSMTLREEWIREYYGNIANSDALAQFRSYVQPSVTALDSIRPDKQETVLAAMAGYELQPDTIKAFFTRWNTSIYAYRKGILAPNNTYPNIVNWTKSKSYSDSIVILHKDAVAKGFESVEDMWAKEYKAMNEFVEGQQNAVCASVTVQLSQRLTMTREAFEGTLEIFNGHPTDKMDSLSVHIKITDENGVPSNDLFEIQTKSLTNLANITGTGAIAAQQKGGVKFLFIPENGAAPTAPKLYNFAGSVTYWDPYAQAMVTMPLSAVPLTVNPSPNLMLHYFMERNILGDDPLTTPDIEPSVPAELAVMVENQGYGPAVNMMISSAQPKVVENEKGLAINFNLIGSNFQGQPKKLGVTDINFGTIPALQTRIGQWYFTSSLLGKFVSYDAKVVHSNSFGNPELSLVNGVKLHELTRSIREYGQSDDHINDFLVNDIFDIHDEPDMIYFSQGNRTAKVYMAASGSFSSPVTPPSFTNKLTVTASNKGWNYIKLNDPGNKLYEIASVTRNDGQVIPLNNAWLTFVTLPVGKSPVYENKFHFADTFPSLEPVTYTVVWKPKNLNVPKVDTITGVPKEMTSGQVQNLKVVFNKRIDPATFTYEDLTLTFQGGPNIMNNSVVITQTDTATFNIDLSSLTTGNGFYNLTVQAANVSDVYGINGTVGKQVTWTQMLNVPVVQAFLGIPDSRIASSYDKINLLFNLPIDVSTVTAARFTVKKDSVVQAGTLTIDSVRADHKLFYLSGLKNILTQSGAYELVVDLPNIRSESQVSGVEPQSIILTVDNTGPIVTLEKSKIGGLDPQHIPYVNIKFNEDVAGFNTASLKLTRNGEVLPLTYDQLSNTDLKTWMAGNFGMLTYPDGNYTFSIDMSSVKDAIGNSGTGTKDISWVVDKTSSIQITNLGITPDRGYADKDGVTSGLSMNATFHLASAASEVTVYQSDLAGQKVLATVNNAAAGDLSIPVALSSGGNTGIKVAATGATGGAGTAEKALFIDQEPLTGQWNFAQNQTITRQVDSMQIALSAKLLSGQGFLNAVKYSRNGTVLSTAGLNFKAVNDTVYEVSGLRNTSTLPGSYELNLDLQQFSKYSSGIAGNAPVSILWTVQSNNRPPVAKAGTDTTITKTGVVTLNGSRSYDPDSDSITYRWIAPEGITLTDSASKQPSFTVSASNQGNTYPFLLIVNDGTAFTTDIVNVKVDLSPGGALPITGLYLKAQQQGKNALITWTTVSEVNTKSFVIERSLDGRTFKELGTVEAKSISNQTSNYTYTDQDAMSLNTKAVYYRLRQINNDGSFTYSSVVTLPVNQANGPDVIVRAYPNPFVQKINLQISNVTSTNETDHVALYSLDGKKLYSQKLVITGNATILLSDLPNLVQGMYLLLTSIDGKVYTTKVVKN